MAYIDSINVEEFKLFRKYNNREERQARHIDCYMYDEPNITEEELNRRKEYNRQKLIEDTLAQLNTYFRSGESQCNGGSA
jgi:hypothetical protein